jgi:hypothetical protein
MKDLGRESNQRIDRYIRGLCSLGLVVFSLGVGKAYNWKIGIFVLILLLTVFEVGYRLVAKSKWLNPMDK